MSDKMLILYGTAASLGFVHTVLGPDHYLPFVAMSRVGGWSLARTTVITVLCGLGHVLSSIVLGLVGLAIGTSVLHLESIEGFRSDVAGWLLVIFGVTYTAWGVWRAVRNQPHSHVHVHADGTVHDHGHQHHGNHAHAHGEKARRGAMTPWVLFTIFLFGPCEPLIPLLMYPAAEGSYLHAGLVSVVFGVVTIATMTTIVIAMTLGVTRLRLGTLERFSHIAAGLVILACGAAVTLGL